MKNIAFLALCLIAILLSVASAEARSMRRPPIPATSELGVALDIQGASVGGSGCKGGSAIIKQLGSNMIQVITPNMSTFAKAGKLERSACSIAIPVKLKSFEALIVEDAVVVGDVALKKNATATTNVEIFHPEMQGAKVSRIDNGKKVSKFRMKTAHFATSCGGSTLLRMNLSQVVNATKSKASSGKSNAKVGGALLKMQVVSCL